MCNLRLILLVMFGLSFLHGCSGLSKEECLAGNWSSIGYREGSLGLYDAKLGLHAENCAAYGVKPDAAAWRAGYRRGMEEFCQPSKAARRGLNGGQYFDGYNCPADLKPAYQTAFDDGRALFEFESRMASVQRQAEALERSIGDAQADALAAEGLLIAPNSDAAARTAALTTIKMLPDRIADIERQIDEHRAALVPLSVEHQQRTRAFHQRYP